MCLANAVHCLLLVACAAPLLRAPPHDGKRSAVVDQTRAVIPDA
jgi:hypothetical protein